MAIDYYLITNNIKAKIDTLTGELNESQEIAQKLENVIHEKEIELHAEHERANTIVGRIEGLKTALEIAKSCEA